MYEETLVPKCYASPTPFGIAIALLIIVGTIISYIPQYLIIVKKKSSDGLNTIMLGISLFSSFLTATNSGILKWPLVVCCQDLSSAECVLNNLATEQLMISVFCVFVLYLLAVIYFPRVPLNYDSRFYW